MQSLSGKFLGVMSGTSLDGLDLALCEFTDAMKGKFEVLNGITVQYGPDLVQRLHEAERLDGLGLTTLSNDLAVFIAQQIDKHFEGEFIIASHGHTVFHQPEKRLTLQIGNPAVIAALTGRTVVADFRTQDVALEGQGAPLVPIGDKYLFGQYESCLNLGGIANVSYDVEGKRLAGDLGACNMVLNRLSKRMGFAFDDGGQIARTGHVDRYLLGQLNDLPFWRKKFPKSLGKEWVDHHVFPLLQDADLGLADLMRTYTEHIGFQIGNALPSGKCLVTGGGTWNTFLVDCIRAHSEAELIVPDRMMVDFKEAIIFAFLGLLRVHGVTNVECSVTGGPYNLVAGGVYHGQPST
ncbi:MAG: anhydro-N-acetylmuramic acid kinase [Flavobacteriales bacterium]|nr:anhydro-N-acetylmuramic acid kinase [Flavobacteriales bacterium]